MGLWLLLLLFGLLALVLWISGTFHQLLPGVLLLCASGRICMSGPLLDVVRAVIAIVLSDRLPIPLRAPLLVLRFLTRLQPLRLCLSWNLVTIGRFLPFLLLPVTNYSTNSYHEVADTLPVLPGYCVDWCIRLGNKEETEGS